MIVTLIKAIHDIGGRMHTLGERARVCRWHRANFDARYFLGYIGPGMRASIYLLSYPNERFQGRVQGVGWALYQNNGASVQGLPQVEETLNWVRLSQRFPVRVVLEPGDTAFPYRMGATAVVKK
jgi:multidrug efflux system membrane fusion protein